MASADPCYLNLPSQAGLPLGLVTGLPQVRTLTFSARLARLLPKSLIASGFVVLCQLAQLG